MRRRRELPADREDARQDRRRGKIALFTFAHIAMTDVRTRFAPSPTGYLHLGGARTALYSWAYARHFGGTFVLRIEDTDLERSTPEAVQAINEGMQWLGLHHDEGPFYQMQRMDRYREVVAQMLAAGTAYLCYSSKEEVQAMRDRFTELGEKPRYDGTWRPESGKTLPPVPADRQPVVRFKNPQDGDVSWDDVVKGTITISNRELDDLVILRSDGFPTYNFAVVVDDIDMKITQVIRGDDHVNNTPRQINIYHALGATPPEFAHLPMILGPDGQKLSKRHGAVSVMQYRDDGFLPHALLNYLVRLGWSHGDQEIFSRAQMIELFDVADVNHSAARFDVEKLSWLNQQYLKNDDPADLAPHLEWHLRAAGLDVADGPAPADVIVALRDRARTLKEMADKARIWYGPLVEWDEAAVAKHLKAPTAAAALAAARDRLSAVAEWNVEHIHKAIEDAAAMIGEGMGKIAQPLRVAMTGTQVSPSIDHTTFLAGRDEALRRIEAALKRVD
jgi:glutamyl-tRNA synthetase